MISEIVKKTLDMFESWADHQLRLDNLVTELVFMSPSIDLSAPQVPSHRQPDMVNVPDCSAFIRRTSTTTGAPIRHAGHILKRLCILDTIGSLIWSQF